MTQWEYEPFVIDGAAREVLFTVTLNFGLTPESKAKPAGDALTRIEDSQKPKIVKKVKPVYPVEAVANRIEGVVVLEAAIDKDGRVTNARVTSAPNPLLDMAALEALKQWEYEPYLVNGKARPVLFTVMMNFALKKD